ncbi:MAG: hypothetical protein ACOYLI_08030 [Synechococcus lacustris]
MLKDEVNREDELKELGWSPEDLRRYAELWEYRKRWGAANLEREERIFLKKADNALPALSKKRGGSAADVKQVEDKLHYKWIELYKLAIQRAEQAAPLADAQEGAWTIILDEELKALKEYQPRLDMRDTLNRKSFEPCRAAWLEEAAQLGQLQPLDVELQLETLKQELSKEWRASWDKPGRREAKQFPVLSAEQAAQFRLKVREETRRLTRELYPSVASREVVNPVVANPELATPA